MVNIPNSLRSGDTWSWVDQLPGHQAPTWSLTYYFSGPEAFNAAAVGVGEDHTVTLAPAVTVSKQAGQYNWIARVTDGITVETLDNGLLVIQPNLATEGDHRSYNERILAALNAVIEGKATKDQLSYSIAGRSLSRMSWKELLSAQGHFSRAVEDERSEGLSSMVFIRFGRP